MVKMINRITSILILFYFVVSISYVHSYIISIGESETIGSWIFETDALFFEFSYGGQSIEYTINLNEQGPHEIELPIQKVGTYKYEDMQGYITYFYFKPKNIFYFPATLAGKEVHIEADNLYGVQYVEFINPNGDSVQLAVVMAPNNPNELYFNVPVNAGPGQYQIKLVGNDGNVLKSISNSDEIDINGDELLNIDVLNTPVIYSTRVLNQISDSPQDTTIIGIQGDDLNLLIYTFTVTVLGKLCIVLESNNTDITCKLYGGYPTEANLVLSYHTEPPLVLLENLEFHPTISFETSFDINGAIMTIYYIYDEHQRNPSLMGYELLGLDSGIVEITDKDWTVGLQLPSDIQFNVIRLLLPITLPGDYQIRINYPSSLQIPQVLLIPAKFQLNELIEIYPSIGKVTPFNRIPQIFTTITVYGVDYLAYTNPKVQFSSLTHPSLDCTNYIHDPNKYQVMCDISSVVETEYQVRVYYDDPDNNGRVYSPNSFPFKFYGLSCLGRTSFSTPGPNPPVDWWFTYKFRQVEKPVNLNSPLYDSYLYHDSQYEKDEVNKYQGLTNPQASEDGSLSPLAATFDQVHDGYSYFYYNDQVGSRTASGNKVQEFNQQNARNDFKGSYNIFGDYKSTYGHSKGIVIYDHVNGNGIHIIHTQPYFPAFRNKEKDTTDFSVYDDVKTSEHWLGDKANAYNPNQNFFCYTFGQGAVDNVVRYVAENDGMLFQFYDPNINTYFPQSTFYEFYKGNLRKSIKQGCTLSQNGDFQNCHWAKNGVTTNNVPLDYFSKTTTTTVRDLKFNKIQSLKTYNGQLYTIGGGSGGGFFTDGIDIYEEMVLFFNNINNNPGAEKAYFAQSFLSTGQESNQWRVIQNLEANRMLSNVEQSYHYKYKSNVHLDQDKSSTDHSKLLFNMNPNLIPDPINDRYGNIFCLGDSNRHNNQFIRGGGFTCIHNSILSSYFQSRVARYSNVSPLLNANTLRASGFINSPIFLHRAIVSINFLDDLIPSYLPDGFIFELKRTYTRETDVNNYNNGVNVIEEQATPRLILTTIKDTPLQKDMTVYRKSAPAKNTLNNDAEWSQTWSYNLRAGKEALVVYQIFAIETDSFNLYKCPSQIIPGTNQCNRETADSNFITRSNNNGDPFLYDDIKLDEKLISLQYSISTNDNPLYIIYQFIETLNNYQLIKDSNLIYEIYPSTGISYVDNNGFIFTSIPQFNCQDESRYLIFLSALQRFLNSKDLTQYSTIDYDLLVGLSLAVSKYLNNPLGNSNLDPCFSIPLNQRQTSHKNVFWHWLVYDAALSPIDNSQSIIPWTVLFESSIYGSTVFEIHENLPVAYKSDSNDEIAFHFTIGALVDMMVDQDTTDLLQSSKRVKKSLLTTNQQGTILYDDTLNQLFVTNGYFTSNQIVDMDYNTKFKLLNSLNRWFENTDSISNITTNQMVEILLKSPIDNDNTQKLIKYLNLAYLETLSTPINLCPTTADGILKICDPISLITITDLLVSLINTKESLLTNSYAVGGGRNDIGVYFSKTMIPNYSSLFNGLMIFTFNDKICGLALIYYATVTENPLDRIEDHCLELGPIVISLSQNEGPSSGNYEITFQGYHLTNDIQTISIGDQDCLTLTLENSHSLVCLVPPGSGSGLPITFTLSNGKKYLIESETFSYPKPIIQSMTPSEISTSGGILIMYGNNFGKSMFDVNFTLLVNNDRDIAFPYEFTNDRILFRVSPGAGKNQIVSLIINGELVDVEGGNQSITMFSYTKPIITSFNSYKDYSSGNTILSIFGAGFGIFKEDAKVYVGLSECKINVFSSGLIFCVLPFSTSPLISVLISNHDIVYSSSEYNYTAPLINSISSTLRTTGGLLQILGEGFGTSIDYLNQTLLDNQLVNCVPQTSVMECSIPKGINPNNFEISTQNYDNSSIPLNIYNPPILLYVTYEFYTSYYYVYVHGENLVPNGVSPGPLTKIHFVKDAATMTLCDIEAMDIYGKIITCNLPPVTLSEYSFVYLTIGGIQSNEYQIPQSGPIIYN